MIRNSTVIGPFVLDSSDQALMRDGRPVQLGPRGVALLKALAERRGEVATKAELMRRVWPDVVVEEANLTVQVAALRKLLGAREDGEEWITTIPRVGYRLAPPLAEAPAPALIPSLAVLPFANLTDDPAQGYFVDGIVEDLITALSRFHSFAVISRNSSFAYRDRSLDARDVARELGVRYLLEGGVQRNGRQVRLTAHLIDGESGGHVWAERFDGTLRDVFGFQDRIVERVVVRIEPRIRLAEIERLRRRHPASPRAYDLYLQALPKIECHHARGSSDYDGAVALFREAVELEPDFALALAHAAWAHERRYTRGGHAPPGLDDRLEAMQFAERAVAADADDAIVLAIAGVVRITIADDYAGLALVQRATELNPNAMLVANMAGYAHFHCGAFDRSVAQYDRALRLGPTVAEALWCATGMARSHLAAGRTGAAEQAARQALGFAADHVFTHAVLVAALALQGRRDEAAAALGRARTAWPDLTRATLLGRIAEPAGRDRLLLEGLRLAGLD